MWEDRRRRGRMYARRVGFRDDELASRARVEVLERKVARLAAENEMLRSGAAQTASPRSRGARAPVVGLGAVLSVLLIGAGMASLIATTDSTSASVAAVLVAAGLGLLFATVLVGAVTSLLMVVPPDRIVVLSGRQYHGPGGTRGYRVVTGGRVLRIPIIERADELPAGPFHIEGTLGGAYTKKGDRVDVHYRLVVRTARHEPLVQNAVERFLGLSPEQIASVARETFEGALRGLAAELTREELREEPLKVAEAVAFEAETDYGKLGLRVDTVQIVEVSERG